MENFPSWPEHILALLFGLIIPIVSGYRSTKGLNHAVFNSETKKRLYLVNSLSMCALAMVIVISWFILSRPWNALGFSKEFGINATVVWLVIIFIVLYAGDTIYAVASAENRQETKERWQMRTPFLPTKKDELPLYFLMCLSAGVGEEIVFRGFLVTYCLHVFSGFENPDWWAVMLPAIVFSLSHYYQGLRATIKIFILSLLFGFIFLESGSLWLVMLLHFLVDAIGGILSFRLMREDEINSPGETQQS